MDTTLLGFSVLGFVAIVLLIGVVIILLVLIQRGKGGGLAGAFGGTGGSSPFGSRAGDAFTRFTLIVAFVWDFRNTTAGGFPNTFNWPLFLAGEAIGLSAFLAATFAKRDANAV